ncbi:SCP-like extracellular [Paenibacillus sp. 79R4]|uniref:CAP domain-containing protein n=1 Tax=Paenibacillus sp. 79R4 TaxID=2212847 RepID=UPI0015C12451|nr:CAP domain-containing protein [Paenibacillus sp. 79R4]NWL86675.1 SCP-like extracellular [Paenibacillus sp. 79R4]
MTNKNLKTLLTGSMAVAVIAAGVVLPQGGKAEAASASNINCNQPTQQVQKVQQKLVQLNWNGNLDDLKSLLSQIPNLDLSNLPEIQKPTTPSEKPSNPDQKPSTGSDSSNNNNNETPTKPTTPTTPTKPTTPTAPSDNNNGTSGQTDNASFAEQVVNLVNQERSKAGLKPLTVQDNLTKVAVAKAADMRQNNYFDHQSPTYGSPFDMMKQFGVSYSYAGENIAKGQRTPAEVMNAWMNSEGHRQNIMSPNFTKIGVAYDNGYWVQEFIG